MDSAAIYGAVSQNDQATPIWARRSAVGDEVREPENRHATIALASASGKLPSAHPVSAMEPTARPCHSPTTPSVNMAAMLTQASRHAHCAPCCHFVSCATGWQWLVSAQQASAT